MRTTSVHFESVFLSIFLSSKMVKSIFLTVWLLVLGSCFGISHGQFCRFDNCYDSSGNAIPCVPSPVSISLKRNVSVTNTCGNPRSEYCELSGPCPTDDGRYLQYCDAKSNSEKHPKSYLVDDEKPQKYTWWQSQNWFETNQLGLTNSENPLKVNITLSFGKSYHISGHIQLTFYNERPSAMFIEKSTDDGHTWQPMQYFAKRCDKAYPMVASDSPDANDPFEVQCTEKYSLKNPNRLGKVVFNSGSRYDVCDYQTPKVQNYLLATNVQIRLEYPATDGIEDGNHFKRYYYAISDIEITGRCNCNGHAKFCTGSLMNRECSCEHNTMGRDCELCKPLFKNRPWSPANKTHGNECQECQCNGRGSTCVYNSTLGYGLCKGCRNNTDGNHCEKCVDKFYRDLSKPLNDPNACVACDCFPDGIVNNGSCLQNATSSEQIGQCACKPNVYGRKCDECKRGTWGFTIPPRGECQACNCSTFGSRGGSIECHQETGQCPCKETTQGQYCNECKFGYYGLPQGVADECKQCPCDLGGAYPGCNKQTGACHCRQGVEGQFCTSAVKGTFYPALDYLLFEAESAMGNYVTLTPANGLGSTYTGRGYAQLSPDQHVHFNSVNVKVTHQYSAVMRYTFPGQCTANNSELEFKVHGTGLDKNYTVQLADLEKGSGHAWKFPGLLPLAKGVDYNFTIIYHSNVTSDCKVQVDSLVLVPYVNGTRVFNLSSNHTQSALRECVNSRIAASSIDSEQANCSNLVFSASTEIYNGTLACDCDSKGSFNPSQCSSYGGQCRCKSGVGGRRCDQCLTGYYNFTDSGCTRCGCSEAGSLSPVCDVNTGLCQCKPYVLGSKCDQCKANTFNVDMNNAQGCQYCFGYGHATGCTSAFGFVATKIETEFSSSSQGWFAVDEQGNPVNFVTSSASGGLIVTAPSSPSVVYLSTPAKFLGNRLWSYKQRLEIEMTINTTGGGEILKTGDVILEGRGRNVTLYMTPSPSLNTHSYHVVLDEEHVIPSNSVTPFEFQSILTNLTSVKVRAVFFPFPKGTVLFKRISLTHAVKDETKPENMHVRFVENATCHQNYSGLSCETCAPGYKREFLGDSPFGRCVLCSCNGRSKECHPDTGVCTNCEVGTYGDRCEHCTNNVQGPDCTHCKTGYWGLSRSGCRACNCSGIGTKYGNTSLCDMITGQCSCNASMSVEGRACDRCKENAYSVSGNSISDCRECSSCYEFIRSDVHKLRPQVAQTHHLTSQLAQHPVMLSNKNFALRFNETVREVLSLVEHASVVAQNDSAFRVNWTALGQAFDSLESLVKNNLSEPVNASSLVASSVQSNHQVIKDTISKVVGMVKKAYRVLNTTVDQRTRLVGAQLDFLKELAVNLDNLTGQALNLENSTLHANMTIHAGVQYAVARANHTAINARTVRENEEEFSPYLEPLLRNATETKSLGEKAVEESEKRLEKATSLLNQTRSLEAKAATLNPDNTRTLDELNIYLNNLNATTSSYLQDTHTIFESSRPVVAQVNSAVERAQDLVSKVSQVVENSTAQATSAGLSNQIANDAINKANQVHHDATYMLDVVRNFERVSNEVILRANASLSKTDALEQQLSEVIGNASSVSVDVQESVNTSMRAIELGKLANHLAVNESKVISEELTRVKNLENESQQAEILLSNQSLREYIKQEIEPKESTCGNLKNNATNLSTQANALLKLANETNAKARRVVEQTQRAVNESKVLALDDPNNSIPELNQAIAKVRESFNALSLTANITLLRDNIQTHKGKYQQYQLRKNSLTLEIKRVRQLIDSFKEVNRECHN